MDQTQLPIFSGIDQQQQTHRLRQQQTKLKTGNHLQIRIDELKHTYTIKYDYPQGSRYKYFFSAII